MKKQLSFSDVEYADKRKKTQKERFLEKMEAILPLERWCAIIRPYYYVKGSGRQPIELEIMLKMYLLSNWFNLSDEQAEDLLCENMTVRKYVGIDGDAPDSTTLCKFRHILEDNDLTQAIFEDLARVLQTNSVMLKEGTIIDATFIEAPNSAKNKDKQPNPNMKNGKKGKKHYFGMKTHMGVDKESGLIHSVATTTANESDLINAYKVLHGEEKKVWGDSGYVGLERRPEICEKYHDGSGEIEGYHKKTKAPLLKKKTDMEFHINKKRSKVITETDKEEERLKSQVRSSVEHVFCIIKHQFGFRKTRLRTVEKNHAKLLMLATLANLYRCSQRKIALNVC